MSLLCITVGDNCPNITFCEVGIVPMVAHICTKTICRENLLVSSLIWQCSLQTGYCKIYNYHYDYSPLYVLHAFDDKLLCLCFSNPYFNMFDSGVDQDDLLFSDSTVRLVEVPPEKQNYEQYLGTSFLKAVNTLNQFDCTSSSTRTSINLILLSLCMFVTRSLL